ncbi:MAG: efflux RND transporter periplasmic adaptor subunit [Lutibacter sp.]|uniref:efflux RND transporter periplasmic adaptor subunit n=1 Tax=Lutibacter sp. TaxID=1925666 RepID=UPI00299DAA32|nr:efflux RND transporter periplasmic adaptor subunit [Lutibacter sp.]MDX1828840.1 efflux RND transporter periplasmic adaptor subunit [Lutibacter sp.]
MKKYKNYIIAISILILGIILGNVFSGDNTKPSHNEGEHNFVQDPVTKLWTCSMHPQIRMKKPGKCPICGMTLIPLDDSKETGEKIASNEIVMTPEAIQLANIQTSVVEKGNAVKEIHLLGKVKPDERRLYSQVSHIPGRIERLYVNFTGEKVHKGQKIVRIYSPDLISAQKELFEAIKSRKIYPQLYTASRNKLKLWKLSDSQINAIEKSGKVQEQIDILSDYSGYVMKRNVELGDHIMEGTNLYDIADLNDVWVMFEAYEADIPWIQVGNTIDFTISAIPNKDFKGKVTYIDPFVSSATRVAKVRVEIKNPGSKLLPEMYANGIIKAKLTNVKNAIIVPKSAVLWTGKRAVVYVKVPHKKTISFVYREIILGQDMGDFYIVEKGLKEGEVIATNGVFRIDASAQLIGQKSMMNPTGAKGNTGGMAGMDMGGGNKKKSKMSDAEMKKMKKPAKNMVMIDKSKIDSKFKKQLGSVIDTYINLKDALFKGDFAQAKAQSEKVKNALNNVDMLLLLGDAHNEWMKDLKILNLATINIINAEDIENQRINFAKLGPALGESIDKFGFKNADKPLYLEYCSMKKTYWLSYDKVIKNPFYGNAMPTCGEVTKQYKN